MTLGKIGSDRPCLTVLRTVCGLPVARRTLHTPYALGAGSSGVRPFPPQDPRCRPSLEGHSRFLLR
jgi:hypothetical protein